MTIEFLPDRYPKADFELRYREAARNLRIRWSIMMDNKKELVAWVGIARASAEGTVFFLPHGAPEDASGREELARSLMSAMVRFARESGRTGEDAIEEGPTRAALLADLAADFRDFGLYSHRERIRTRNCGKPDWGRTIKSQIALPGARGEPIYCDVSGARPSTFATGVIAMVQAKVVAEISRNHGWWLKEYFGAREIPRTSAKLSWPRAVWPKLLLNARRDLYQGRAIRLVNMLLSYLEDDERTGEGNLICGVSDFSTVWESMLRKVLPDVEDSWNDLLPGPAYTDGQGKRVESGRMQMDVVVRRNRRILIVDAKYYRATTVGFSPGWADIVKQVYYQQALQTVPEAAGCTVTNAFFFPAGSTGAGPFNHVEMVSRDGSQTPGFPRVRCQYISVRNVISAYSKRQLLDCSPWLDALLGG